MIRIPTTEVRVGDHIRTYTTEGIVTEYRRGYPNGHMTVMASYGPVRVSWRPAGSVELLSDLNGRLPIESFGRW